MSSLFALLLLFALALCAAAAFSSPRLKGRWRWGLRIALLLVWVTLAVSLWQIFAHTAVAMVMPGSARKAQVVDSALSQLLTLAVSLGGPAALITFLGLWTLRATRDGRGQPRARKKRKRAARLAVVREAGRDLDDVRRLFEEYARALDFDLGFHDLEGLREEIRRLPADYTAAHGRLLLARVGGVPVGCIALQALGEDTGELKRLFVRPDFRHDGLGRELAQAALDAARELRWLRVKLDTLPSMREAIGLYRSLGFTESQPFGEPPTRGALFFELAL